MKYNFNKIATLNQGTSYDYGSVMQYHRWVSCCPPPSCPHLSPGFFLKPLQRWLSSRYAFSKNGLPTMVPIPNNNVAFGEATQMSRNDIDRLNRLYKCCEFSLDAS